MLNWILGGIVIAPVAIYIGLRLLPQPGISEKRKEKSVVSKLIDSKYSHGKTKDGIHYAYPLNISLDTKDSELFLFVHGFPETWYAWRFQLEYFTNKTNPLNGKRIIPVAIDLRGFNDSTKQWPKEHFLDRISNDLRNTILHLGFENAVVIGHDWGGIVVQQFATQYPEMIERLVVMNVPHPAAWKVVLERGFWRQLFTRSWYFLFMQLPNLPEMILFANDFDFIKASYRQKGMGLINQEKLTDDVIEYHKDAVSQPGTLKSMIHYYREVWTLFFPTIFGKGEYGKLNVPTLVFYGEKDYFMTRWILNKGNEFLSNGKIVALPNCSHWANQDQSDIVNQQIFDFASNPFQKN